MASRIIALRFKLGNVTPMARVFSTTTAMMRVRALHRTRSFCAQPTQSHQPTPVEQSDQLQLGPPSPPQDPALSDLPHFFNSQSYRRVQNSPVLPLDAVAVPGRVQTAVHAAIKRSRLTPKTLRSNASLLHTARAPETFADKRTLKRGPPIVQHPPEYTSDQSIAYLALRMPGTLTSNIHVMGEARRARPQFFPTSVLDFGAGVGVSLMAAARSFNSASSSLASAASRDAGDEAETDDGTGSDDKQQEQGASRSPLHNLCIKEACIVDQSAPMLQLAQQIVPEDPNVNPETKTDFVASLRDSKIKGKTYDLVCASYSLNEIVRSAMAAPTEGEDSAFQEGSVDRGDRVKLAETRLRKAVKSLWARTAVGGLFVAIEDGTASGFETINFIRDLIFKISPPGGDHSEAAPPYAKYEAEDVVGDIPSVRSKGRIVAPCLHQKSCPLQEKITRHAICRFQQRLNRPLFSRNARQMPTGYEDEYFSYVVFQKLEDCDEAVAACPQETRWGRLIRAPLRKGKHVSLDACTRNCTLERRVISKKSAAKGEYARARRARWGDAWPTEPRTAPQALNF